MRVCHLSSLYLHPSIVLLKERDIHCKVVFVK